ncbi:MAG TPA: lipid-A-disaccharide synthase [Isosphaeraceae bacterium]|nr:lipid-A-disaccharide synthase [Isosphaeraceae bacterium]
MRIFISAGEPSGDLHAANLLRALQSRLPGAEFFGFGGPKLESAGARLLYPLVNLSVMWFGRVLLNMHKFLGLISQADRAFLEEKPDAVVLIDYPGLHWWLARRAKARGIPVFYYVPPQIWAWFPWRVRKVRKYVDHVLCSLPFEPPWYHARGVPGATFVGHPYFDELKDRPLDESLIALERSKGGLVVTILPGSRTQEITRNFPVMLRAARLLSEAHPEARFLVACLHERHQALAEEIAQAAGAGDLPLAIHAGKTAELIRLAQVAWAVSGSVGLELMNEAVPTVVLYTVKPIDLLIARPFIKARFISLVNLLAGREIIPEYLTAQDAAPDLARWARLWLEEPEERARVSAELAALREQVAQPGASDRAAERIAEVVLLKRSTHPAHGEPVGRHAGQAQASGPKDGRGGGLRGAR